MAHASGANWGTTPNGSTFTGDIGSVTRLATSAPFSRYLTEQIVENSAMIQSGLIQTDARLNNITGVLAELPFFDQLAYTEENIDSSAIGAPRQRRADHSKAHRQHPVQPDHHSRCCVLG